MTQALHSRSEGSTLILTIDNQTAANSLTAAMCIAGIEALNAADSNDEIRSVIITAAGDDFCADTASDPLAIHHTLEGLDALQGWVEAIRSFSKPVIAAIEGRCLGNGLSIACACDLLVASETSTLGAPVTPSSPGIGGGLAWNLHQLLPRALAFELLCGSDPLPATRWYPSGGINRLCANGHALTTALLLANRMDQMPSSTLMGRKELLNDADTTTLSQHMKQERLLSQRIQLKK